MRQYLINEQQLGATIEYLMTRPMGEVEQAVNVLRRLPVHEADQPQGNGQGEKAEGSG